jgi:hypothetical protein
MGALNQLLQDAGFTDNQGNVLMARKELVSFSPLGGKGGTAPDYFPFDVIYIDMYHIA